MVIEDQTFLHGLLAQQSESELVVMQELVEAAKVSFLSRHTLVAFTVTLTVTLLRLH